MTENPKSISQRLLEINFRLPGRENHIPLLVQPYSIRQNQWNKYVGLMPYLVSAVEKAYNLFRQDTGLNPIEDYSQYPFIWRFDFLTTPISSNQHHEHKMLELNATRPGGIWLLLKAHEAYEKVFGINGSSLLTPSLDLVGSFFRRLSQRVKDGEGRVGLAYTSGYVAEIEMPRLAEMLNIWAEERGYPIKFISADRDNFSQYEGAILDQSGKPLTVFYENAAPQQKSDGQVRKFNFSGNYYRTVIVNHPEIAGIDNKLILAYLRDSRLPLSLQETEAVRYLLPDTYLIRNKRELEKFLASNLQQDFFFKISDGLRASSGKGVFDGRDCHLEEIEDLLNQGNQFVIQRRIPPDKPWYTSLKIDDGELMNEQVFLDFNPYVFSDGRETVVNGVLVRAKDSHPINVSQGGALGCVKVNN